MNIGIIREGKIPPDSRVPLTPKQCAAIQQQYPIQVFVEPSSLRCYTDTEYRQEGILLTPDLSHCDVLIGVKEVPIPELQVGKTYFFFSHTIKKQSYNRTLLQAILEKKITLIDYEVLTDERGNRVIAFGKFAGMVGAHNTLWTYSQRTKSFALPRMKSFNDYAAAKAYYQTLHLPPLKIVLTGTGRVGNGAAQVLRDMGIRQLEPEAFLHQEFEEAVFTQLQCQHYVARKDGTSFTNREFYTYPEKFKSTFEPFTKVADLFINGIYWDNRAPTFFTKDDMRRDDFAIQVIGDITCDIAPISSIPSTLRASTIENPVFGYDPQTECETTPFQQHAIDMMTIDNLPSELPRDASEAFGEQFLTYVVPELVQEKSDMLEKATITKNGQLTERYSYLQDYVAGKE